MLTRGSISVPLHSGLFFTPRHSQIKNCFVSYYWSVEKSPLFDRRVNPSINLSFGNYLLTEDYWRPTPQKASKNLRSLGTLPFISFFKDNLLDVPDLFGKSDSLKRDNAKYLLTQMSNIIMRKGFKRKVFFKLNRLLAGYLLRVGEKNNHYLCWESRAFIFSNLFRNNKKFLSFFQSTGSKNSTKHSLWSSRSSVDSSQLRRRLVQVFTNVAPVFSFYVYKVKKKIYKNTRGKSGKFTFLWKYVPHYKRLRLVASWISRELIYQPGLTLESRLNSVLLNLFSGPKTSVFYELRKYCHNYLYRNARRTLGANYRTVKN